MISADYWAIALLIIFALLGLALGFGRGLKLFTSGIFGQIIAVIVCYFTFGMVCNLGFVRALLDKFVEFLQSKNNGFLNFLVAIRVDIIVLAIVLFGVVQLARRLVVSVVRSIMEIDNPVMSFINRSLGLLLFVGALIVLTLIVFQVINWVGGSTAESLKDTLAGSALNLDEIFENNPLMAMVRGKT